MGTMVLGFIGHINMVINRRGRYLQSCFGALSTIKHDYFENKL